MHFINLFEIIIKFNGLRLDHVNPTIFSYWPLKFVFYAVFIYKSFNSICILWYNFYN